MKAVSETAGRQYYIDWLRVLAMVCIFFFHNARFFDVFSDWHVKNATTNVAASALIAFMSQWIMPLFFVIAAAGLYYALKSRGPGQFIQERCLRLLIPLIFGMLVIVVPQAYFQAVSHGELPAGYNLLQIYGLYLQTLPDFNTFHLWFLVDLFIFSLITLPLFYWKGSPLKSIISRLAAFFDKPWALLLLLVLSLAVINTLIYPEGYWGYRNGGWNIAAYLLFFILGYLIVANPRIMETIKKMRWIMLGTGIIAFVCSIVFFLEQLAEPVKYYGSAIFAVTSLLQAVHGWAFLLAILGFGGCYLERNNKFLAYSNEAVLPFYILHQTVIISIGFYVVQWSTGIGLKYLVISTTSFMAIMLIYELLVRRINALRFLFGMRLKRKQQKPL